MYIEQHMTSLFITYKDVCDKAQTNNDQTILKKFHKQKNFAAAFQLIFNFKNPRMASLILDNWERAIEEEILACEEQNPTARSPSISMRTFASMRSAQACGPASNTWRSPR